MHGIEGRTWQLTRGVAMTQGSPITARFVDGTMSGSIADVRYRSDYDADGDALRIGPPSTSSELAATGGGGDFVTLLRAVARARVEGDRLELLDADGRAILTFDAAPDVPPALVGRWSVRSIAQEGGSDAEGATAAPYGWLEIAADGSVTGSGGVNRLSGNARADGDRLFLGPLRSTRMAGAPAAMDAETALLGALDDVAGYRVSGDRLELLDGDEAPRVQLQRS